MTEFVYMNGDYVEKEKATIPVNDARVIVRNGRFLKVSEAYYNEDEGQLYAFRVPEHFVRLGKRRTDYAHESFTKCR